MVFLEEVVVDAGGADPDHHVISGLEADRAVGFASRAGEDCMARKMVQEVDRGSRPWPAGRAGCLVGRVAADGFSADRWRGMANPRSSPSSRSGIMQIGSDALDPVALDTGILGEVRPLFDCGEHFGQRVAIARNPKSIGKLDEVLGRYPEALTVDAHLVACSPLTSRVVTVGDVVCGRELPVAAFR